MDVDSGEILLRGLSMPHSPRWYAAGSGSASRAQGRSAYVDLERRTLRADRRRCPASPAGSTSPGRLAFVGLSQVRESAVFSGIPITERLASERTCGVWVVDLETGQPLAFLRFETAVQEIFAVQVLPGCAFLNCSNGTISASPNPMCYQTTHWRTWSWPPRTQKSLNSRKLESRNPKQIQMNQ